ncbi:MAG: hypothetical protein ABIC91_02265 [Nanoarchaeota archaeon]|nr:hypothetical protein [Nanoarchaeota archaeon]MBU1030137.1 hypothetical protein [Nanoarchaeota archaeon]MBU1850752.1 hypothetical protein [Nanoarchaeota archaeon]
MKLCKTLNNNIKKMKWYDISLTKLSVLLFTLFLVTVWPGFHDLVMKIAWYWYLILGIIVAIPVMKKVFCKK